MIQAPQSYETRERNPYLESFDHFENGHGRRSPSWLSSLRKAAIDRFSDVGFPSLQDEDWRFTNVTPIRKLPFKPVLEPASIPSGDDAPQPGAFASIPGTKLVFLNGQFAKHLSTVESLPPGVILSSLSAALDSDGAFLEKHLGAHAPIDSSPFTALNTAFFTDGALIRVPRDTVIENPIHLEFIFTGGEAGTIALPRNLIVAEHGSKFTVVESFVGTHTTASLTNAITELVLAENSSVEYCKFQDEPLSSFHIAGLHAALDRNSSLAFHSIATGARLSRNDIRTKLDGENVDCVLNGLYLTKGDQLADHFMIVEHAKAHCNSHEYFNGILDGRSRGVFHGRIFVHPEAQKTDAKQTNKNLLLSDDAVINTKPQLEIYADDVKCTHGATIGQLDEESIFYLRARGVGHETARRMLMHAFAAEIVDRIHCQAVRDALNQLVWERLEQNPNIASDR